jgi:transposase
MAGPAPAYQPTFTAADLALCQRTIRQHSAPQARAYRARLALLLHERPAVDNEAAGRALGKHANWVRYWRKTWVREGFRLTDKPGRGGKPALSPPGDRHRQGAGLRAARAARPAAQPL